MLLAFCFGLVHGFGFANVLAEVASGVSARAAMLFSFNLGVEIGQLGAILLLLPALAPLRRWVPQPELVRRVLATSIAVAGLVWTGERLIS